MYNRQRKKRASYLCGVIYLLYAILIFLAYQFIFKLVIPVYLASRKIKKGFREMKDRMQHNQAEQTEPGKWRSGKKQSPPAKESAGEYIDFEEVK